VEVLGAPRWLVNESVWRVKRLQDKEWGRGGRCVEEIDVLARESRSLFESMWYPHAEQVDEDLLGWKAYNKRL